MDLSRYPDSAAFLEAKLPKSGPARGARSRLAQYLHCQTSFISQVMNRRANLTLEQAMRVAGFLRLDSAERDLLLLLVQRDRAGSQELKNYYGNQIREIERSVHSVRAQIDRAEIPNDSVSAIYYSSWIYTACHILCALPQFSSIESLQSYLQVRPEVLREVLRFLEKAGFVEFVGRTRLRISKGRTHIESGSMHAVRHHVNWRVREISRIEKNDPNDLHFSAMYGISETDALKIKDLLLRCVREVENVVTPSTVEAPYLMLLDFHRFEPD